MKRIFFIILISTISNNFSYAQRSGIAFRQFDNWAQVVDAATHERKFIFVDAFATWCAPCKAMEEEVFPQERAGNFFNQNFICIRLQMDRTQADNEPVRHWYNHADSIAKKGHVNALPTMLFFSADGDLIHKAIGFLEIADLIKEGEKAIDSRGYYQLMNDFRKGLLPIDSLPMLAYESKRLHEDSTSSAIFNAFMVKILPDTKYERKTLSFIADFLTGTNSEYFKMFFKESDRIDSLMGKNYAEKVVMNTIASEFIAPVEKQRRPNWNLLERQMNTKFGKLGTERVWGHRMLYSKGKKDWAEFGKYFKLYFDHAIGRSFLNVNTMSWNVFERINDKSILHTAIKAMKYDLENYTGNDPASMDTYANLLYKVGNKKDAIEWEEKAVALSNNDKDLVATLEKMKRGEPTWLVPESTNSKKN